MLIKYSNYYCIFYGIMSVGDCMWNGVKNFFIAVDKVFTVLFKIIFFIPLLFFSFVSGMVGGSRK